MKNAFGCEIPSVKEIVTDSNVKETVASMLTAALDHMGILHSKSQEIVHSCLEVASSYQSLEAYEEQAHNIVESEKVTQRMPAELSARANFMYSQIAPYLLPNNLLDYGCGDAQISELFARNNALKVSLTDVYEHKRIKATGLTFKPFRQGEATPFPDAEFNNVLSLAVFHHSSYPIESIKDVSRLTRSGGRVVVVESVYGVDGKELPPSMQKEIADYLKLSAEQQHIVNVFFDHYYNRILAYNPNVKTRANVPFNFNTPDGWKQLFAQYGLKQEKVVHLGLDTPFVPEYHTMHILRKIG